MPLKIFSFFLSLRELIDNSSFTRNALSIHNFAPKEIKKPFALEK